MTKVLRCGDIIAGCDEVIRGETEEEVLQKGAAHAREAHGASEISPEMAAKVKAAIRDEG